MNPRLRRSPRRRRDQGLVMVSVLFFVLLLVSAIATFVRRASVDGLVARNRDRGAQAEALARGAVPLAMGLVLEDRLRESQDDDEAAARFERHSDVWALVGRTPITTEAGELHLRIEDAGARLNLNALFADGAARDPETEPYLERLLEKVVFELEVGPQGEDARDAGGLGARGVAYDARGSAYDPLELARNLIDWVDEDGTRLIGGPEDAYYQDQIPPYRAANRPLLSVDELALIEGFDRELVDALRPYVGVHPLAGGDGINPNTAPSYVLAALYHGPPGDRRLADADSVRALLDIRAAGGILCADGVAHPDCTPLGEVLPGDVYPPPTFQNEVFHVTAEARVADVQRTVQAVLDRSDPAEPRLLQWRVR